MSTIRNIVFAIGILRDKKRLRQWRVILDLEAKQSSMARVLWDITKALCRGNLASRELWEARTWKCENCIVADKFLKRCRPWNGASMGCGCHYELAALWKREGWATEAKREPGSESIQNIDCW